MRYLVDELVVVQRACSSCGVEQPETAYKKRGSVLIT